MTITLELNEDRERELREIARRRGQNTETFLLSLADEAVLFEEMEAVLWDNPQERAEALAGVQRGLDDFTAGRHKPMEQVFANLKARHGIPD